MKQVDASEILIVLAAYRFLSSRAGETLAARESKIRSTRKKQSGEIDSKDADDDHDFVVVVVVDAVEC